MSGSCTDAAAESREKDDEFGGLEQLIGQRAETTHTLLSQRRKRCATDTVEGVAKPEHVDVITGFETPIIGVDEHQMGAPLAFCMGLPGPSTADATHSSKENVGGVHDGHGAWHLHELWCSFQSR
jgi:hypothetical protein